MAVYRFRVVLEENDDVYRDIDIKSIQSFEELHHAIQEAFKFDKKHAASFFVSDDYWRKGLEITLRKEDLPLDEDEIRKKIEPKKLMAEVKVAKYVETPHQRFVYIFDPVAQWSFLIELLKIVNEEPKTKYPACVKSIGNAPKQYKVIAPIKDELGPEAALLAALKGPEPDDDEIYKTINNDVLGVEEEDLNSLEGEEGEESENDDTESGEEESEEDSFSFEDGDNDEN